LNALHAAESGRLFQILFLPKIKTDS